MASSNILFKRLPSRLGQFELYISIILGILLLFILLHVVEYLTCIFLVNWFYFQPSNIYLFPLQSNSTNTAILVKVSSLPTSIIFYPFVSVSKFRFHID